MHFRLRIRHNLTWCFSISINCFLPTPVPDVALWVGNVYRIMLCKLHFRTEKEDGLFSLLYWTLFSRILNAIQSYTESYSVVYWITPTSEGVLGGDGLWRLDGLKRMSLGFEMLLQNEIRRCDFQNIAIHRSLSLLYLCLIGEYQWWFCKPCKTCCYLLYYSTFATLK